MTATNNSLTNKQLKALRREIAQLHAPRMPRYARYGLLCSFLAIIVGLWLGSYGSVIGFALVGLGVLLFAAFLTDREDKHSEIVREKGIPVDAKGLARLNGVLGPYWLDALDRGRQARNDNVIREQDLLDLIEGEKLYRLRLIEEGIADEQQRVLRQRTGR